MLRRNIDTRNGLVNSAIGTVLSIKTHHIKHLAILEQFHGVEKYLFTPQTVSWHLLSTCQGLLLDCAMMDLSNEVFCAGMAYMALKKKSKIST